jgi:hypothetical protein
MQKNARTIQTIPYETNTNVRRDFNTKRRISSARIETATLGNTNVLCRTSRPCCSLWRTGQSRAVAVAVAVAVVVTSEQRTSSLTSRKSALSPSTGRTAPTSYCSSEVGHAVSLHKDTDTTASAASS